MGSDTDFCHASEHDHRRAEVMARREADWRLGPVVYQVLVDRFVPPNDLEARRHLYAPPRRLRPWDRLPRKGRYLPAEKVWSHELDFWGGDLRGLRARGLNHVVDLGADVLYLNPIHDALTNHKYDARDYCAVAPEYGDRDELRALCEASHERGLRLVLDGVFNHMGRRARWFRDAMADEGSRRRGWFFIGPEHRGGVRRWADVDNLPALRLEHPAVQARIWGDRDSVIRDYLRDGVDGWRLDVAYDMGPAVLAAITAAAHDQRPGSLVLGEIWNYPEQWFPAVDGVLNFFARQLILHLVQGRVGGAQAGRLFERMIDDAGLEPVARSWLFLDNHDTARLQTVLRAAWQRRMAQVLQFCLPGAPGVYYGSELGQRGGRDPANRAPMRWDLVRDDNDELAWTRWLVDLRQQHRALRVGDFRLLDSERLLAFMRLTERVEDTVIVLANPTNREVSEVLAMRDSRVMNRGGLTGLVPSGRAPRVTVDAGLINAVVPARGWMILAPEVQRDSGYSQYLRVQ